MSRCQRSPYRISCATLIDGIGIARQWQNLQSVKGSATIPQLFSLLSSQSISSRNKAVRILSAYGEAVKEEVLLALDRLTTLPDWQAQFNYQIGHSVAR